MTDDWGSHGSPHNLPHHLTSFIGRERERAEITRRLGETRLLTLTGPGGCGKTRLGLEVAFSLVGDGALAGGVWVVELAALADPALVPQAVALALGAREASGRPLTEVLVDYLGPRSLLLLLDNCEHLVEACAQLVETLLRGCPKLHVLATSREPLRISGEVTWLVPSLRLPSSLSESSLEEIAHAEAVRLFVERAAAVQSNFTLSPQNAAVVTKICHDLDGIPLAIELAAARVNVLSVEQIAERLDDALRLLTGGSRTALPRQQTLQATIEWSYQLLSEPERILFRRLAVFSGKFSLEAVEAVCSADEIKAVDVLDLVSHLVDKSLMLERERSGQARYRLLETIRQYSSSLLSAAESASLQQTHARYYLALAEAIAPKLNQPDRRTWLEKLDVEHNNLRAALQWALAAGDVETALRLAGALWWFWFHRGYWSEGRSWLSSILDFRFSIFDTESQPVNQSTIPRSGVRWQDSQDLISKIAQVLLGAGVLAWGQGDHLVARTQLEASVSLFRELADKNGLGYALQFLSQEVLGQGDPSLARSLATECVAIFRDTDDSFGLAISLVTEGVVAQVQAEYSSARSLLEESAAILHHTGDKWTLALALRNLGYLAFRQGDFGRAAALQKESLALLRDLDEKWFVSRSLEALAEVTAVQENYERAAQLFGASEALREVVGASVLPYYQAEYEQGVAAARTGIHETRFAAAWAKGRAMTLEQAIDYAIATESREAEAGTLRRTPAPPSISLEQALHSDTSASEPELRIFILGPAQVYRGETLIATSDWGYAKPKELLFYLLCHPARTKTQIGLAFWPDASPAQLRRTFHTTLHHVRRALGRPEWIIFEDRHYAFNRSLAYWFDLEAFETHLTEAEQYLADYARHTTKDEPESHSPSSAQAIPHLESAIALYHGDLLEDFTDGDWYLLRREELRRKFLTALLTLGRLLFALGRYAEAVDIYRQAISHDTLLEEAHRELMRCLAQLGERGQALRHYQSLLELLRDELGTPPAAETTALFVHLRRG